MLAVAAVLALVLVGCGSTVSNRQLASTSGGDVADLGGGAPATAGTGGRGGAATGSASGGTGRVPGGSSSGGKSGSSSGGTVGGVAAGSLPVRPAAPVEVGFHTFTGTAGTALALALPPMPDPRVAWQALVDQQNARGGLLGHKIVPVYFTIDGDNDLASEEQSACAMLTQDHHVLAAFVGYPHSNVILDCLERTGAAAFNMPSTSTEDAVVFQQHPHARGVGNLNWTRAARVNVDGLFAQGFFTRGAKIGLVVWDDPVYARVVSQVLKPALALHGLRLTAEARVPPTRELSESGPAASQSAAAVLSFKSQSVTHVLFMGGSGAGFFFIKAAEGQNYYPQYGLSSNDAPASLSQNVDAQSLRNFWGVGWFPNFDIFQTPTGPRAAACKALMTKAGQPVGYEYCDSMDVMVTGALAGGAPLSVNRMLAGLDNAGRLNLAEFTLDYRSHRRDGIILARNFRYQSSCTCLRYTSATYPVP